MPTCGYIAITLRYIKKALTKPIPNRIGLWEALFLFSYTIPKQSLNFILSTFQWIGEQKTDDSSDNALVFSQVIDEGDCLRNHSDRSRHDNHNRYHVLVFLSNIFCLLFTLQRYCQRRKEYTFFAPFSIFILKSWYASRRCTQINNYNRRIYQKHTPSDTFYTPLYIPILPWSYTTCPLVTQPLSQVDKRQKQKRPRQIASGAFSHFFSSS